MFIVTFNREGFKKQNGNLKWHLHIKKNQVSNRRQRSYIRFPGERQTQLFRISLIQHLASRQERPRNPPCPSRFLFFDRDISLIFSDSVFVKIFRSTLILSIVIARSVPAMLSARSESWKYFDYIFFEIFTLLYFLWYLLSGSTWLKDTLYDIHCLGQVGYHAKRVAGIVGSWEQR